MARIRYDRRLLDGGQLITITNADTDGPMETAPESFINPPIKMNFLNIFDGDFESLCRRIDCDDLEIGISNEDAVRMVRGELPGWRLVGAEFTPDSGFAAYYVSEYLTKRQTTGGPDEHIPVIVPFFFIAGFEVELEVDYADGLPVRRYIGKVTNDGDCRYIDTVITEYQGKRKVRKMEFSEREYDNLSKTGFVCHITEY